MTRVAVPSRRYLTFDSQVGRRYLTRLGHMVVLVKIDEASSPDNPVLTFEYTDPADKTRTRREGFDMNERTASRLLMRLD